MCDFSVLVFLSLSRAASGAWGGSCLRGGFSFSVVSVLSLSRAFENVEHFSLSDLDGARV